MSLTSFVAGAFVFAWGLAMMGHTGNLAWGVVSIIGFLTALISSVRWSYE